jgi:pyrroline-5-carboxylate reductase
MQAFDQFVFLGGGHLSTALIAGLRSSGCPPERVRVLERNPARRAHLLEAFGVVAGEDLLEMMAGAQTVVLAVRPKDAGALLTQLSSYAGEAFALVSCVAGLLVSQITAAIAPRTDAIIRAMPNLPAVVQASVAGLYCEASVADVRRHAAERLLRAVGTVVWLKEESLMHAVTAVSGSGPGYVFRLMDALNQSAIQLGLSADEARMLVVNVFFGSAKMALESTQAFKVLCEQVCVPGGTTEQGVAVLDLAEIDQVFEKMAKAAKQQSEQLTQSNGGLN